jgi:hypothetical protein
LPISAATLGKSLEEQMPAYRGAKLLRPMAAFVLLSFAATRPLDAASTQLQVTARVLPTRQAAAASSQVSVIGPDGTRRRLELNAQEKQALTSRIGTVPAALRSREWTPGVHVIEISF